MNREERRLYDWSREERIIIAAACELGNIDKRELEKAYLNKPESEREGTLNALREMVQNLKEGTIKPLTLEDADK